MKKFFMELTDKIKAYDNVIIMTHKNMDIDGFASSLCLHNIINNFGIKSYIYLSHKQSNDVINRTFKKLDEDNYKFNKIYKEDLNKFNFDNTLLIVVDIYKRHLVENEQLLDMIKDIIVIDHHIIDDDYIENTIFSYINPNMSSVAEIMLTYVKLVNYELDSLLATMLLCAMEIDTNAFNFKTTPDTFKACAYLLSCGASSILKQKLLRENKSKYLERYEYIKNSYFIDNNILLCVISDKIVTTSELAIIADSLLQFEDIEASFCMGKISMDTVGISARSIGNINVQKVMLKLGGGGHATDAATKLQNLEINECERKLKNIVRSELL